MKPSLSELVTKYYEESHAHNAAQLLRDTVAHMNRHPEHLNQEHTYQNLIYRYLLFRYEIN